MFWVKNSAMFNSSMMICDKILNYSDFLQFWKIFDLMRILTNLLKFCVLCEICMLSADLLSVFLCWLKNFIVCHCCEQFINTWEFIVLSWVKMNSAVRTASFFSIENWLEAFWKKLSQIVSFLDSFWKKLSQNVSFCVIIETADDWFKSIWKKLLQILSC